MLRARGALVDFGTFLEKFKDMSNTALGSPSQEAELAHREAMDLGVVGLLGGGAAPNSRPLQLVALTATKEGAPGGPWPCIFAACTLGRTCPGNMLRI